MGLAAQILAPTQRGIPGINLAPEQRAEQGSSGLLGLLQNLGGDVAGLVKGIATAGASAAFNPVGFASDVATNLIPELVTGGQFESGDDYRTLLGQVLADLPASTVEDLKRRYVSLLPGGAPASEAYSAMYNDPLSYILDALAVASAGSSAAAGAAGKAIEGSGLALGAKEVGTELFGKAAGARAGLEALASEQTLSPSLELARKLLPGTKPVWTGNAFELKRELVNPLSRAVAEPIQRYLTTVPIETAARTGQITPAAYEAGVAEGITRVERAGISDLRLRNLATKLIGEHRWSGYRHRDEEVAQVADLMRPYVEADPALGTDTNLLQRLDVAPMDPAGPVLHPTDLPPGIRDIATVSEDLRPVLERVDALAAPARAFIQQHLAAGLTDATAAEVNAAERWIRSLYDPIKLRVGESLPSLGERMMDDIRLWTTEHWQVPGLERGSLTFEKIMRRAYLPLSKMTGKTWRELDDALVAQGISAPVYLPHQLGPANMADYLMPASRVGGLKQAESRAGFLRRNRAKLLEEDSYNKSITEVFQHRAAQEVVLEEAFDEYMQVAQRFGRPIESTADLHPGEAILAPEGMWRIFRTTRDVDDVLHDLAAKGELLDGPAAQTIHAAVTQIQDELPDLVERIMYSQLGITRKGIQLYAIPRATAKVMDAFVKPLFGGKSMRLWYDTPLHAWRNLVLLGRPAWIVNNTLGNTLFLKLQGGRLRDAIRLLDEQFRRVLNDKLGWHLDTPALDALERMPAAEKVTSTGFIGTSFDTKMGTAAATTGGKAVEALKQSVVGRAATRYGNFMRGVNSAIEDAYRGASYLKAAEREAFDAGIQRTARAFWTSKRRFEEMASYGISDAQATRAFTEMEHFMGNYRVMSPFEQRVVRRFIFPFWSFFRHQAQLLIRFPLERPFRAVIAKQIAEVTRDLINEYGPMPGWLEGALPLGAPGAQVPFLSTRGPDPFSGTFQPIALSLNPLWKFLLEQSQGRSLLTDQPFTDRDVITPFGSEQPFRIIRDAAGNPVDVVPVDKVSPSIIEGLLSQIPQYESLERGLAGGKVYDTASLVDVLQGQAVIPGENGPAVPASFKSELLKLAGYPVTNVDLGSYQKYLAEQALAALQQAQP